jgi:hypothetical protein
MSRTTSSLLFPRLLATTPHLTTSLRVSGTGTGIALHTNDHIVDKVIVPSDTKERLRKCYFPDLCALV